ncbi:hypothetical protein [Pseudidiomarina insulisalsae]|uniref:Uncharacterized protein n=1 Tax=Pseudidiomarina insulisalsae TaxID=575789 RepID=A0A432YPQ1_9GAMM|nr:hypothetical protein [Pseudidiomarina insulisalsae]RUO63052.1 hypothetical protein CWI71_02145 [Pseudidiomarina insulisalsae]
MHVHRSRAQKLGAAATALFATLFVAACQPQAETPHDAFLATFKPYCGNAYAANVVTDNQPSAAWQQELVVHIRDCEKDTIRMPLHVGEDRSRTWVLTHTGQGIDFQHIHLHEDGTPDAISPYGGHTAAAGAANRQAFPVDEASKALFIANGLDVSTANTWIISFDGDTMYYELSRPGREFVVAVDLSQPIAEPPAAWGYNL